MGQGSTAQMNPEIQEDFNYSNLEFRKPTPQEDKEQGIDGWICGVPIAYRKRKKSYNDITIRHSRKSGAKTEYIKILDGSCRAFLYFFDFPDKIIICSTASIKKALENHKFTIIPNTDGITDLAIITLDNLKALEWRKWIA